MAVFALGIHEDTSVRPALAADAEDIHGILAQAFEPYRRYYTQDAYYVAVPSPGVIEERVSAPGTGAASVKGRCSVPTAGIQRTEFLLDTSVTSC